jgi:glycosyltransferase involved in cell wall biosynthesis
MNNNFPLVSVIMNCYNSDKYLNQAIDSVIAQTYQNWEIIFWDNQSQDRSAQIVNSYNDQRIKYFYAPNHTVLGEARNKAVAKASGMWLGILDCDDIWYKDKLEKQLKDVDDNTGMIYTRAKFLVESSGSETHMAKSIKNNAFYPKRKNLPSGDIFNDLLYECFIPLPSVLIRKDLFFRVGGINSNLKVAEDYDIFLKISQISNSLAIDRVLCEYRVHSNNLSHHNIEVTFKESIELVSGYKCYKSIDSNIAYWRLKHLKVLMKKGSFLAFFSTLLSINLISIFRMIKNKYL